jgi:hypothetical protein
MKFIFAFVFLFAVIVGFNIQKPAFRDIEFASFDVNSYRTTIKDSVFIGLYCSINSTGLVKIYNPNDLRDYPKIYYSYQLADNELKKISSLFTPKKTLQTHLITTELGKNSLFAGSYHYYRASYIDNKVDSICTITPFVSAAFREVEEILSNAFYSGKGRSKIE